MPKHSQWHGEIRQLSVLLLVFACTDRASTADSTRPTTLQVHTTQHASLATIGLDSLTGSAHILQLFLEPDGDALVVMFADPMLRISSGLAIIDPRSPLPQLVWPDSVTAAWWPAPHQLAFTTRTGPGAFIIIDVHAADLVVADSLEQLVQPDTALSVLDSALRLRAQAYTDSTHMQIAGTAAQRSALTYGLGIHSTSPSGRLTAFHTMARDGAGKPSNPAWFVMNSSNLHVIPIDQVIGPITELPGHGAGWANDSTFYYAKGRTIWKAEIQQPPST